MTYRISRISLYNFKSHVSTRLDLPQGTIALLGENGAGKSSILEAIQLILSPPISGSKNKPLSMLVNEKMRDSKGDPRGNFRISLELKPVEGEGVVEAIIEAGQPRRSGIYVLKVNGKIIASGKGSYLKELYKLLGLQYITDPASFIRRAVIVEQGGLQRIASLMEQGGPSLREEIEAAIGIPDIKAARKRLDEFTIPLGTSSMLGEVKVNAPNRNRLLRRASEVAEKARKARDELREAERRLRELEIEARELEDRRVELNSRLEALRKNIEGIKARLGEASRLERQIGILRESLRKLEDDYRDSLEASRELESIKSLSRLKGVVDELRSVRSSIEELRVRLEETRQIRDYVDAVESNRKHYERYKSLVEEVERLEAEKRGKETELIRLESELKRITEERLARERAIRDKLESVSQAVNRGVNNEGELRSLLEELKRDYSQAKTSLEENRHRLASIEAELEDKRRILEVLSLGETNKCPVCGSPLTRNHAERLREKITSRVEELLGEAREYRERISRLSMELEKLEDIVRLVENTLEIITQLKHELSRLPDTTKLEAGIRQAERELGDLKARLSQVEEELSRLEESRAEYISALRRIERRGISYDEALEIARSYEDLKSAYDELLEKKRKLEETLLRETNLNNIDDAEERVREAYARLPYLEEKARRLGELERRLKEVREELGRLEEEKRRIEASIDRLSELEDEEEKVREELSRVEERYQELTREKASLEARINTLKEERERLEREKEDLELAVKRLTAGLAVKRILERLQEVMYKRSLIYLENEMSKILDSFNLDPVRVEIRDTDRGPTINVITRAASERSISMLSGGERTSIALAYVLALNKMMGSRIGFLALDEPTSELDQERRETLVDILSGLAQSSSLGIINQLIVVTHHEEVIDKMDVVCRVKKERGESKVRCGDQQ
ncbi:MAG: SMC family ATPase [Desulfurococcales archaeon]|nr:SMC family ATPase [Desulfurococcales archaeon]